MKRCIPLLAIVAGLFAYAQSVIAGEKEQIAFTVTPLGGIPVIHQSGVVTHVAYSANLNQLEFTAGPLAGSTGSLVWEGNLSSGPDVGVGSGTGVITLENGDVVFLTKWHFSQQVGEPFTLRVTGVGVGVFDGVWFDTTAEGSDPSAPYDCIGLLMDPKATK